MCFARSRTPRWAQLKLPRTRAIRERERTHDRLSKTIVEEIYPPSVCYCYLMCFDEILEGEGRVVLIGHWSSSRRAIHVICMCGMYGLTVQVTLAFLQTRDEAHRDVA